LEQGQLVLGPLYGALARDVGAGGLFLAGPRLACGTRLHLYVELPDGNCVEAWGEVAHRGPRVDAHAHAPVDGVGVRLVRVSPRDAARLERFLDERRAIEEATTRAVDHRLHAEAVRRRLAQPRLA
jgi:hypothetical protein